MATAMTSVPEPAKLVQHMKPDLRRSALRYVVNGDRIDTILCHRKHSDPDSRDAKYLVRWKSSADTSADAPVSWHDSEELKPVLHILQKYIEGFKQSKEKVSKSPKATMNNTNGTNGTSHESGPENPLKRSRDEANAHRQRRAISVSSLEEDSGMDSATPRKNPKTSRTRHPIDVYNAVLKKRDGIVIAVPATASHIPRIDATSLPGLQMQHDSVNVETIIAEVAIRRAYEAKLKQIPGPKIDFINTVDRQTPNLSFRFMDNYVYHSSAEHAQNDALVIGCTCRPKTSSHRGCDNASNCDCLSDTAPDESAMSDAQRAEWRRLIEEHSEEAYSSRFPRTSPYTIGGSDAGCLTDPYLSGQKMIYECNAKCSCDARCANRNVQFGRKIRLQVFKTRDDRGFGLKTLDALRQGQFIDVYRGEIISDAEADERDTTYAGIDTTSYMFALDKLIGEGAQHMITQEQSLTVDGRECGSITRFANHSCDPNSQMHTVSYSKYNHLVYDLAFFACRDVPASTELTIDYCSRQPDGPAEADVGKDVDMAEGQSTQNKTKVACRCGAKNCRGTLWT